MRVLEQTDELKMDLTGIMTLQRKLSGMERDLAAIEAKLKALEAEADKIKEAETSKAAEATSLDKQISDLKLEESATATAAE